jgi:hypothetical protein
MQLPLIEFDNFVRSGSSLCKLLVWPLQQATQQSYGHLITKKDAALSSNYIYWALYIYSMVVPKDLRISLQLQWGRRRGERVGAIDAAFIRRDSAECRWGAGLILRAYYRLVFLLSLARPIGERGYCWAISIMDRRQSGP